MIGIRSVRVTTPRRGRLFCLAAPVLCLVVWLTLIGIYETSKPASSEGASLCTFRNVTGIPCPTCGTTRVVLAAGQGRLLEAFAYNPLMFLVLPLGLLWLLAQLEILKLHLVPAATLSRSLVIGLVIVAFVTNWLYVIQRENGL